MRHGMKLTAKIRPKFHLVGGVKIVARLRCD